MLQASYIMSSLDIHHEDSEENYFRVNVVGDGLQADIREQGKKELDGRDHISVTEAPQNIAPAAILVIFP